MPGARDVHLRRLADAVAAPVGVSFDLSNNQQRRSATTQWEDTNKERNSAKDRTQDESAEADSGSSRHGVSSIIS